MKMLARDSEERGDFRPAATGCGNDHLAKKLARVRRATVAPCLASCHFGFSRCLINALPAFAMFYTRIGDAMTAPNASCGFSS
jgi:hypothetical protein